MAEPELSRGAVKTPPGKQRSFEPITDVHLRRLSTLALQDHRRFTRDDGRPEYRDRRLLVVLAQGAAKHFVDGTNGIKDLDVWTFYANVPGQRFPADRRNVHVDFGPSELGRIEYDLDAAPSSSALADWRTWSEFEGRRVDLLMRALPISPTTGIAERKAALLDWLENGIAKTPQLLRQKPMVGIWPPRIRGSVLWAP